MAWVTWIYIPGGLARCFAHPENTGSGPPR